MPELDFNIAAAEPAKYAAVPTLNFKLAITQGGQPLPIRNISLQCQIRIDATKRSYKPEEQTRLTDLFGEPERWSRTLQSMLWVQTHVAVPSFGKDCLVDLPVPCSFDFNLAATKYFHGLTQGEVPLLLLFSGSVFYHDDEAGLLAMDLIPWDKESHYRLPVDVWRDMMEIYYPNRTWLCVNRRVFDALYEYKRRHGYTGFDEALNSLLPRTESKAAS